MLATNASNSSQPLSRQHSHGSHRTPNHHVNAPRFRTPTMNEDVAAGSGSGNNGVDRGDTVEEEDPRQAEFRDRFAQTESRILALFREDGGAPNEQHTGETHQEQQAAARPAEPTPPPVTKRKAARAIDEDDYGDDEDDEEDDDHGSPLQSRSTAAAPITVSSTLKVPPLPTKPPIDRRSTASSDQGKTSEDVRKKLQEDRQAAEDAVKRSLHTLFYTLESDRDAMLEQQKLDELDRQVENEVSGQAASNGNNAGGAAAQQGTLSSANLGASSLSFKHLIARIDAKRNLVQASDAQLRSLLSEVRKNRSKWANEEKVGQEELYEAAERVLLELKAQTDMAAPFLQRVNKREAPDYFNVIKNPMDIGTMLKKLKTFQYKSKKEFVDDLNLIWQNCLRYNTDKNHHLRKKALYMRKETERLVPLIPDITVRDRAEVEAEERRQQLGDAELDGVEDSDDEEPIMASRGRKAPSKGKKGTGPARKAPPAREGTPAVESKPPIPTVTGATPNFKQDFTRADSDAPMEGSRNGFSTPPPGTLTPLGQQGVLGSGAPGSQADTSEVDGIGSSVNGMTTSEDPDVDDWEYKTWKQLTKKARATVATERNRLFRGGHLNPEATAMLRSKAGMRRWMRQHNQASYDKAAGEDRAAEGQNDAQKSTTETLAEGIEDEEERFLPDYYDVVNAVPDLNDRLRWVEDAEGNVVEQGEEFLRMVPKGLFTSPESTLTKKMEANMRQMQETRKVCAKIGVVKQMQLQSQMYQNQFQKYDPQPFLEADIQPHVVSDDGPIMAKETCRATLRRSVGKIMYHAGFEEFQPSALDAITDIAGTFFTRLVKTYGVYKETPKVRSEQASATDEHPKFKPRFTGEEAVLHTLHECGQDLEALESYVRDDVERLGSKLGMMHNRMKEHLAELLRPALDPNAGADGAGAFTDGSEQFVGGDFAEEIGEDFFGFKELGLDQEFGLASLSVPLHLLQNRMHSAYQAQNTSTASVAGVVMEPPPTYPPVTIDNVRDQIGLVQGWFLAKLHANNDEPLIEDEELPVKQRFPKPRLPPSGKISSPRKRPLREQQQMAKKKRKLEESGGKDDAKIMAKPVGKLRLEMPETKEPPAAEPEKDEGSAFGMMSPESLDR